MAWSGRRNMSADWRCGPVGGTARARGAGCNANAARMAAHLPVDHIHAEVDPKAKQALIRDLQAQGRRVHVVGDGLNDTLAVTQAWASIAPGTVFEASQNAADVVLLGQHLSGISAVLRIARSARRRILENFALAVG